MRLWQRNECKLILPWADYINELYDDPLDDNNLPIENDVWNNITEPPRKQ